MFKLLILGVVVAVVYAAWRRRAAPAEYTSGPTIDVEPLEVSEDRRPD